MRFIDIIRRCWRPLRHRYSLIRQWLNARYAARRLRQRAMHGLLLDDLSVEERETWKQRIDLVVRDNHNQLIPRCSNAGTFRRRGLIMHNGQVVCPLSYYGTLILQMLVKNRGVHEPEEEYVFSHVLPHVSKSGTMLELGSYWAFYSMWFLQHSPNRVAFMVEPDPDNLAAGMKNFALNGLKGEFVQAFVGSSSSLDGNTRTICVDQFLEERQIRSLDILHCDIQGFECEMIEGAKELLSRHAASCVFISTHSNELHLRCRQRLTELGYLIIRDTDLDNTSSFDGLLFACTPAFEEAASLRKKLQQ